jgi:hypothetical protein
MLKGFRIALALMVLGTAQTAFASDYIQTMIPGAAPVGSGRLSMFFMDVYDVRLYADQGRWNPGQPLALEFRYLRNIKGARIADSTVEEIRKQGYKDELKLAAWHEQMRKIFPDVHDGLTLTGIYTNDAVTVFYKDGVEIGQIKDPEFGKSFFNIWLDKKTSAPRLREKLLGQS